MPGLGVFGAASLFGTRATAAWGLAAGVLNTSIQLGGACGLGVVAALIAEIAAPATGAGDLVLDLRTGLAACAGFAVLALTVVLGHYEQRPEG